MYEVTFDKKALKQLERLPKDIQKRIISTIERCRVRPYSFVKKLVGINSYRLRVGDYRVIMDVLENEIRIHVIDVKHRKNAYKN